MSTTTIVFTSPPERVEEVLLDAHTYPRWVIGTDRCDAVHPPWPAIGGSFTYSWKLGPLRVHDRTTMVEQRPGRSLTLDIRVGPAGHARVVFEWEATAGGGTTLTMREDPVRGPIRRFWNKVADRLTDRRNEASLQRLRTLVDGEPETGRATT